MLSFYIVDEIQFFFVQHPGDRIILTQKAKNQIFTYTHELPMGIASQNRFWLIHKLPSWEISDLQFLGH